jgi:glycosyltransferase involved in cell wall biosynthesis
VKPWDRELLASRVLRAFPGRVISFATELCFAATRDCADVAERFFGVPPSKIAIEPLGVDTEVFFEDHSAVAEQKRNETRASLGCRSDEILCIYTGRFTAEKNPLLLAQAVAKLRAAGAPYRALFVGNGPQEADIAASDGSSLRPFAPFRELPPWFRAADIAVYPTQESMSMLDAAACGLPLIVNDTLQATERIDGNGIQYKLNDVDDLVRALLSLRDAELRRKLGARGADRMAAEFSWTALARRRLDAYSRAVNKGRRP